jgi:nicotinate-nucleotide adenylyltransferase
MKLIGIMGGAFNPIHSRHLMVAQSAVDQLGLDEVLFVPTGDPPHKKTDLLDKEARYEMVAAACADNPRFTASRIEIDRPGTSWTLDTLKELTTLYAGSARLHFIIGEDNLPVLKNYAKRAEFLSLCRLVVSPRSSVDPTALALWKQDLPEADLVVLDCPANEVSSTIIRHWLRAGRSVRYLVHEAVCKLLTNKKHYLQPASQPTASTTNSPTAVAPVVVPAAVNAPQDNA